MQTESRVVEVPETKRYILFRKEDNAGSWPTWISVPQIVKAYRQDYEEYTPNSTGGRHIWKHFEHYRAQFVPPENAGYTERALLPSPRWYRAIVPDIFGQTHTSGFQPGSKMVDDLSFKHYVKRPDGGFVPPPADLTLLLQSGINVALPKIKSELSLLNTIIELKDIRTVKRSLKGITNLVSTFGKIRAGATLKQVVRSVADSYLQSQFNVQPLLRDIRGIRSALRRTERRINDFVTRRGRVQRHHYQRTLNEETDTVIADSVRSKSAAEPGSEIYRFYSSTYNLQTKWQCQRYVTTVPAEFHMEIEYNYNYTQYQVEHARLLALLDGLGVNYNPAIIWNAIPWSFVVDWVIGVNRWLDQFAIAHMEPTINIRRCLWSIKRRRRCLVTAKAVTGTPFGEMWPETPGGYVDEVSFARVPFGMTTSSITSSGLSLKEVSLGAALVVTRRRRHSTRT